MDDQYVFFPPFVLLTTYQVRQLLSAFQQFVDLYCSRADPLEAIAVVVQKAHSNAEVSLTYIQRLLRDQRVEGVKMGRDWFVYEDSLKAFIAQPRKRGRPHKDAAQEGLSSVSHAK